jgi:two-component system response regulator FlrC
MTLASLDREQASTKMVPRPVEEPSMHRRILVIDHDNDFRLAVCDRLRAMGFDAAGEDSGISGLDRLAREAPHTPFAGVLLELDMPALGGMAVLQELRDRYPSIPVIAMSHSVLIDRLRQAVRQGAREYLVKPLDTELFRTKCLFVFDGKQDAT